MSGQLSNIDETGAPSIYFHDYPHIMEHDAYSGDFGLGFFGSSLEASSTLVIHPDLGPLCFLCDLAATGSGGGGIGGGGVSDGGDGGGGGSYVILPRDAYRQRTYLEPLGVYLQADAGRFSSVELSLAARTIRITFAPAAEAPAGEQTYDVLRLRMDKVSVVSRPGSDFRVVQPAHAPRRRSAYEIPAPKDASEAATVLVSYT
jgi:hypothetical protein